MQTYRRDPNGAKVWVLGIVGLRKLKKKKQKAKFIINKEWELRIVGLYKLQKELDFENKYVEH